MWSEFASDDFDLLIRVGPTGAELILVDLAHFPVLAELAGYVSSGRPAPDSTRGRIEQLVAALHGEWSEERMSGDPLPPTDATMRPEVVFEFERKGHVEVLALAVLGGPGAHPPGDAWDVGLFYAWTLPSPDTQPLVTRIEAVDRGFEVEHGAPSSRAGHGFQRFRFDQVGPEVMLTFTERDAASHFLRVGFSASPGDTASPGNLRHSERERGGDE